MYEWIKQRVLCILKVPPEPDDPMGDVDSLMVFRASYNFFRYRFYLWLIKNIFGILSAFGVGAYAAWEISNEVRKANLNHSMMLFLIITVITIVLIYSLLQTLVSYIALRLDYELRWYKISDRSLRIREGVVNVREISMTFANIQNIEIVQGPVQRFFGIADLRVESAGGGSMIQDPQNKGGFSASFHSACFRGVDNAVEIRDIMRKRLKKIKSAGLNDDDEEEAINQKEASTGFSSPDILELLNGMKEEAVALRSVSEELAKK